MKKLLALLLCSMLFVPCALGEGVVLPAGTTTVDEEAFSGDSTITTVVLQPGVKRIGPRAFADCENLLEITIPATVESIGEDAFSGCTSPLLIRTEAGSAARTYANAHGIDYHAGTVYRALLIGQMDYAMADPLTGPENDLIAMRRILTSSNKTPYTVTTKTNCTEVQIKSAILSAFAGATENDVSLFYYSGHGMTSADEEQVGSLVGVDSSYITAAELRSCLDAIPGRKIVIIDACHSGKLIGKSTAGNTTAADAFNTSFISAFSWRSRTNLAAGGYYVMTAAHSSEYSYEATLGNNMSMGVFTYCLALGCGYNHMTGSLGSRTADADNDGVVNFYEAYVFAKAEAKAILQVSSVTQTAQYWPSNAAALGFIR